MPPNLGDTFPIMPVYIAKASLCLDINYTNMSLDIYCLRQLISMLRYSIIHNVKREKATGKPPQYRGHISDANLDNRISDTV